MKRLADDEVCASDTRQRKKLVQATLVPSTDGLCLGAPTEASRRQATEPSESLQREMRERVAPQLARFLETQGHPECAFHAGHRGEMRVAYRGRFYDELVRDFMASSGTASQEDLDLYLTQWNAFHTQHASLRLLCTRCYQSMHPAFVRDAGRQRAPTDVKASLRPSVYSDGAAVEYNEHAWLEQASWGEPNDKGNYSRQLDGQRFTLFRKNTRWLFVYNGKYGTERYHTTAEALRGSYNEYRDLIRRCS